MYRRATALAVLALAGSPGVAAASTELNVIPHGQTQPGVSWATQPGMLPADAQARMYDRLTPFGADITDAMLAPSADGSGFFKSAALKPVDDPSYLTDETITATAGGTTLTARIRRDRYGVPNIYSATDAGVIFGAGYVTAQDRSLLLDQARDNGIAGAIDLPGAPAINLILGLYQYTPTAKVRNQVIKQQDKSLEQAGSKGRQVLRDIDTYLVGINKWYGANRPDARPFDRGDIYALNAVKAQFLGQGGGEEVPNAMFLDAARDKFGKGKGSDVYEDLRQRNDPETSTTTARKAAVDTNVPVKQPKGLVRLEKGSFRSSGVRLPGSAAAASSFPGSHLASNVLLVNGSRSATGTPIMVGGPQIGYNYPGLTLEIGLHGPTLQGEGATSAPFPGYLLIGRGQQFAWTLTSADGDIVDTYAEKLCGGSRAKYVYKGRCRKMETVKAGTISLGDKSAKVGFRRTVHGPVIGYARVAGSKRVVALSQKRSSAGRETNDQIFFQDLSYGRVRSAQDFIRASAATPQTFNSFYADAKDIAFITTGRLPVRPQGRQRRPAGRRAREVRVEGRREAVEAPAGHRPVQRAAGQLEQQAGQGLPRGRQPLGGGRHAARRLAAREPREAGQAHAGHRARRRERRGDRRPARADVARRDGDPQAQAGAQPARAGGRRRDHALERQRRELGRRERRRRHRRARPGRDGGDLERPRERRDVRPARQPALHRAQVAPVDVPGAAERDVRRLAPVHVEGPADAGRRQGARALPPALLRQGQGRGVREGAVGRDRRGRGA